MKLFVITYCILLFICGEATNKRNIIITCNETSDNVLPDIKFASTVKLIFENHCEHSLRKVVEVTSVRNLYIQGMQSTINCIENNTGLIFENVSNIMIENLRVVNCTTSISKSAVFLHRCHNISITNVAIYKSGKTGLKIMNASGIVSIVNSKFTENWLDHTRQNSDFEYGGGFAMATDLFGPVFLDITDCEFSKNHGLSGAGASVLINSGNNRISITGNIFTDNKCTYGGGGLEIGFNSNEEWMVNNTVHIKDCIFNENTANYGGGTAIYSSMCKEEDTELKLTNCSWYRNSASFGHAVDISAPRWINFAQGGLYPSPHFSDCRFINNSNNNSLLTSTLKVSGFKANFSGKTVFKGNKGSALCSFSAFLTFKKNSDTEFYKNKGEKGGAINMMGLAFIFIEDETVLTFTENEAITGGAIYADPYAENPFPVVDQINHCFVRYQGGKKSDQRNVTLIFDKNIADKQNSRQKGDSIFVVTIGPCLSQCIGSLPTDKYVPIPEGFKCIGNFIFNKVETDRRQLSTNANHFAKLHTTTESDKKCSVFINITEDTIKRNENYNFSLECDQLDGIHLIPGKAEELKLQLIDDVCGEVFFYVSIRVKEINNGSINIDSANSILTDNKMTVYGKPQSTGKIELAAIGVPYLSPLVFDVTLDNCPPGFIIDNFTDSKDFVQMKCVCSVNSRKQYMGIEKCQDNAAYVKHGYWIGYEPTNDTSENNLATAICPRGYCKACGKHECVLSENQTLNEQVCEDSREGRLCGLCKPGTSVSYKSLTFSCVSNSICSFGILFYIISELIPITIFFIIIIYFNISFTSGALNGIIFSMQILTTLKLSAEDFITLGKSLKLFADIQNLIYRMFALSFFEFENISYCLWEGATTLDVLAFKYVTIIYSLALIFLTVILFKVCSFCKRNNTVNIGGSVIQGLVAFLVCNYLECARISLLILTNGTLEFTDEQHPVTKVVFYYGKYEYLHSDHLRYAIPAMLFAVALLMIPIALLAYPQCYKLFTLLGIEDSKAVSVLCKLIPFEKMKPLFDAIQGDFKDNCRFFAGLYFLYRLCILVPFTYTRTLRLYYSVTNTQLIFMLAFHAVFQPYKKRWHNILDAALFTSLLAVNCITSGIYQNQHFERGNQNTIQNWIITQRLVALLPLTCLICYIIYCIVLKIKMTLQSKLNRGNAGDETNNIMEALDRRAMDNQSIELNDYNYRLLGSNKKK